VTSPRRIDVVALAGVPTGTPAFRAKHRVIPGAHVTGSGTPDPAEDDWREWSENLYYRLLGE
jgi:hypothetical protein